MTLPPAGSEPPAPVRPFESPAAQPPSTPPPTGTAAAASPVGHAFGFGRRLIRGFEKWSVVLVLLVMTVLPAMETLARRFWQTGIPGSVLWAQHLTLWVGFLGALLATATGNHLALATGELLPKKLQPFAKIIVGAISAAVAGLLAYAAYELVKIEFETWRDAVRSNMNARALPGGVPEWVSQAIMPVTLALIAARFVWRSSDRWIGKLGALGLTGLICMMGLFESQSSSLVGPGAIVLVVALLLGAPVFVAMAGVAMLLFFGEGTPIAAVPGETYRLVLQSSLPAIPLLTGAGYVLAEGGASKRLLRLARALIGWAPGGVAVVIVLVLAAFTTFTGGSGVTILALGGLVLPMLVQEKYPEGFSLGLVTSSGSLGLLFPPSLPVILYALVAQASIEELFIAGFVPGLLLVLLVAAWGVFTGVRVKAPRQPFQAKEALSALWAAKWELAIPAIVISAIFTGFATMVEAASLAVIAAIVSQTFIFGDLHWRRQLPETLARAATLVGAVIILLGVAMGLTSYLVDAEIPSAVLEWTKAHIQSPVVFLLALNAVLLVLGSVLEIYSAIIILAPLLAPMAVAYGIDPLHLGVVFLVNLELGFLFPPMGLNLILSSTRFRQPLTRLYKVALPFLIIMAVGLMLTTYVPSMTTGVLSWVKAP